MKLKKGEYIVTAFAESHAGPGWANKTFNVVIANKENELRIEYLQPNEWEKHTELRLLFALSENINYQIINALNSKR